MHYSWLRKLAADTVEVWRPELNGADIPVSRILLCGSLHTGLLTRSKPAEYSGCPWRPPRENVVEVDVRIVLERGSNCCDPRLLDQIGTVTGTIPVRWGTIERWTVPIPMAVLYAHSPVDEELAIEWEICVNVEPYFETTDYWRTVFSDPERAQQRRVRVAIIENGFGRAEYEAYKAYEGAEFRWRTASALVLLPWNRLPVALRRLRRQADDFPGMRALTALARSGKLPRPTPPSRIRPLLGSAGDRRRESPVWVRALEALEP